MDRERLGGTLLDHHTGRQGALPEPRVVRVDGPTGLLRRRGVDLERGQHGDHRRVVDLRVMALPVPELRADLVQPGQIAERGIDEWHASSLRGVVRRRGQDFQRIPPVATSAPWEPPDLDPRSSPGTRRRQRFIASSSP